MFDLPNSCLVDKFIPKKIFYEKLGISNNLKNEFINLVEKIVWKYKLSSDTLGVNKTDSVEEIQIFEIYLKEKIFPKNIIKIISKGIPYKILFMIKYESDYCYAIKVEDVYFTYWNEDINIDFKGLTLETIYENIVKKIIKEENNNNDFEIIIENNSKKNELLKKIEQLKNKIKQEHQFNRKLELNQTLRKLEKELEELENE